MSERWLKASAPASASQQHVKPLLLALSTDEHAATLHPCGNRGSLSRTDQTPAPSLRGTLSPTAGFDPGRQTPRARIRTLREGKAGRHREAGGRPPLRQKRIDPVTILRLEQRSGHDARVAGIGVTRQPRGYVAHDSFRHPAVVRADDWIGDEALIWCQRPHPYTPLPAETGPVWAPDRLSVWPVEGDRFGIDAHYHGFDRP